MPALAFTDQRERLRRIVENALAGAVYEASREEEGGRMLILEARRDDGRRVALRFRGVKSSESDAAPVAGGRMRLLSIGSPSNLALIGLLIPILRFPGEGYSRVRIEAGAAQLDIVCQDAEWWEMDDSPRGGESRA